MTLTRYAMTRPCGTVVDIANGLGQPNCRSCVASRTLASTVPLGAPQPANEIVAVSETALESTGAAMVTSTGVA